MDYNLVREKIPTFNSMNFILYASLKSLCAVSLLLLLVGNSWAFETNVDSKITANFEVTGALKAGSVDSAGNGIVTSIADNDNDTTIPTTGAVKAYIDAQVAASSSSSSGGYPTQISQPKNTTTSIQAALAYCVGLTVDGGGWRLPTVDEFINACSRDEACRTEGSNGVLYRTATPVLPSTAHPYTSPPWPDWVVANYWKLDASTGIFEDPVADVRCVK